MKCRHCFVHDALNKKSAMLSAEEFHRMSAFIPALQRVHLGGGEPFTRPDIGELAVIASNNWNAGVVCIPTNGWFTDKILSGMCYFGENSDNHLRLHFSINSHDPEEMDRFTLLKGSFKRWRHSIDEALRISHKYPRISIVALATFNEHNQDNFQSLIDFLHEEVGVHDFSFQIARTHPGYSPKLDIAHFRKMNDYYFRRWNKQNPFLASFRQATRAQSANYFETPSFEKRCTSGRLRVVISPSGDVYPCEKLGYPNLREMNAWHMGNIRDFNYDIHALVRSDKAAALYKQICESRCHCDHNIDQSLRLLSSGRFRSEVIRSALNRWHS
jgi:radical SAM protein with 4Fe4S-binding SPASM domain